MPRLSPPRILHTLRGLLLCALALAGAPAHALAAAPHAALPASTPESAPLLLAGNTSDEAERAQPLPGELVLPDDVRKDQEEGKEKQCMTVCARWGEECTLVNRGGGGTSRQCRRTCKQFAEECF